MYPIHVFNRSMRNYRHLYPKMGFLSRTFTLPLDLKTIPDLIVQFENGSRPITYLLSPMANLNNIIIKKTGLLLLTFSYLIMPSSLRVYLIFSSHFLSFQHLCSSLASSRSLSSHPSLLQRQAQVVGYFDSCLRSPTLYGCLCVA